MFTFDFFSKNWLLFIALIFMSPKSLVFVHEYLIPIFATARVFVCALCKRYDS